MEDSSVELMVFDLDGTLAEGICWARLNVAMGVPVEKDRGLRDAYLAGKINMVEWVGTLKDLYFKFGNPTKDAIQKVAQRFTLYSGTREAVNFAKRTFKHVAIISGAYDLAVEAVADDLRVDFYLGNAQMEFDRDGMLKDMVSRGEDAEIKVRHLESLCGQLGVPMSNCACVGDSENDLKLFIATKRGITFSHCNCLHNFCWRQINSLHELPGLFAA